MTGPETLTDYELGAKTKLFNRKLTLNLAAYYYDFKGYQIGQIEVIRDANGNILSSSLATLNAEGATNYGLEAEGVWDVTPYDHLQLAGALQKTKLKSLLTIDQRFDGDPTDPAAQRQLAGNELPHAPRFAATLTYEHDFELPNSGKISPRGTLHYETASFHSIFNGDRTNRVVDGHLRRLRICIRHTKGLYPQRFRASVQRSRSALHGRGVRAEHRESRDQDERDNVWLGDRR